jgi:hypothetical protein
MSTFAVQSFGYGIRKRFRKSLAFVQESSQGGDISSPLIKKRRQRSDSRKNIHKKTQALTLELKGKVPRKATLKSALNS